MSSRRTYDHERSAHFVTFSCFKRRRLLDHDQAKRIVLGVLNSQLSKQSGRCVGFVLMPDHVHAIVWFPAAEQISHFMKQWKQRTSTTIKQFLRENLPRYAASVSAEDPFWQSGFYDFNLQTRSKLDEKLAYIHENPVRAGLVGRAVDWDWSSARYYLEGRTVGLPIRPLD